MLLNSHHRNATKKTIAMKKFTLPQTLLLAALTLIIGFFVGMLLDFPKTDTDELAGTIGKASKYHNVKVTEEDIQLRNDLLEDTALRSQYERYLTYYYYQAMKTSSDLETVLKNTADIEAFKDYLPVLNNISDYLKNARVDLYGALRAIKIMDSVQDLPLHVFLNDANNAIARMSNQTNALMYYLDAIGSFLEKNPNLATAELRDAHDILAINLVTSAAIANDKPTLRYLDKKKMTNDKERVKELIADVPFNSEVSLRLVYLDAQRLGLTYTDKQNLGTGFTDQAALRNTLGIDFEIIVDQIVAGSSFLFDSSRIGNVESLRVIYLVDQSPLQGIIYFDSQRLGGALFLKAW